MRLLIPLLCGTWVLTCSFYRKQSQAAKRLHADLRLRWLRGE